MMLTVLPSESFEQQAEGDYRGIRLQTSQWASPVAVKPLAKLSVSPDDFPFLDQMNGHNLDEVMKRVEKNPDNFPWHAEE